MPMREPATVAIAAKLLRSRTAVVHHLIYPLPVTLDELV